MYTIYIDKLSLIKVIMKGISKLMFQNCPYEFFCVCTKLIVKGKMEGMASSLLDVTDNWRARAVATYESLRHLPPLCHS